METSASFEARSAPLSYPTALGPAAVVNALIHFGICFFVPSIFAAVQKEHTLTVVPKKSGFCKLPPLPRMTFLGSAR
jgi:hypothetical protein